MIEPGVIVKVYLKPFGAQHTRGTKGEGPRRHGGGWRQLRKRPVGGGEDISKVDAEALHGALEDLDHGELRVVAVAQADILAGQLVGDGRVEVLDAGVVPLGNHARPDIAQSVSVKDLFARASVNQSTAEFVKCRTNQWYYQYLLNWVFGGGEYDAGVGGAEGGDVVGHHHGLARQRQLEEVAALLELVGDAPV